MTQRQTCRPRYTIIIIRKVVRGAGGRLVSRKKYSVKAESRVSRRSVSIEVGMATSTLNRQTVQPGVVPYSAMAIQVQCVLAVRASRLRASPSSSVVHREQHCGGTCGVHGAVCEGALIRTGRGAEEETRTQRESRVACLSGPEARRGLGLSFVCLSSRVLVTCHQRGQITRAEQAPCTPLAPPRVSPSLTVRSSSLR